MNLILAGVLIWAIVHIGLKFNRKIKKTAWIKQERYIDVLSITLKEYRDRLIDLGFWHLLDKRNGLPKPDWMRDEEMGKIALLDVPLEVRQIMRDLDAELGITDPEIVTPEETQVQRIREHQRIEKAKAALDKFKQDTRAVTDDPHATLKAIQTMRKYDLKLLAMQVADPTKDCYLAGLVHSHHDGRCDGAMIPDGILRTTYPGEMWWSSGLVRVWHLSPVHMEAAKHWQQMLQEGKVIDGSSISPPPKPVGSEKDVRH